jgi:hypothetical protein
MKNPTVQQYNRNHVKDALYRVIDKVTQADGSVSQAEIEGYLTEVIAELRSDEDESEASTEPKRITTKDLPERLTNPRYGREELDKKLKEMATNAPSSIEEVWKITERLPSFSQLISQDRDSE